LDIPGVGAIETKFAGYRAGEKPCALVDYRVLMTVR